MKFTRIMGELALASGAIAGILFITAPPLPSISAPLPLSVSTPQPVNAEDGLGLDTLVGIAQFVQNPTQYHVVCDDGLATITAASLKGDRMTIHYTYSTVRTSTPSTSTPSISTSTLKTGKLIGIVNSDGLFSGTHQVESPLGDSKSAAHQGDVTFSFSADGTAKGKNTNGVKIARSSL